jgi:hypothetical protein
VYMYGMVVGALTSLMLTMGLRGRLDVGLGMHRCKKLHLGRGMDVWIEHRCWQDGSWMWR